MEILPTFEAIRTRRACRRFSSKAIDDRLLFELLELANTAPSGFNLQPWYFILVRDEELRGLLAHVALDQEQIIEAPATIVFVADPTAWRTSYPNILQRSVEQQSISADYAAYCRRNIRLLFRTGTLGLLGIFKRISVPLRRFSKPTPQLITSRQEAESYVRAHTMLSASTFMIAACGAGLATCPMEGFDEERLKKLLAIPKQMTVPVIIPVGFPIEGDEQPLSLRLPLVEKLSVDLFPNKLSKLKQSQEK